MEHYKPSLKTLISLLAGIIIFFALIIGIQEYTLITGKTLYLKTIPVDPRDILRGDYVTLRYEFETDKILEEYIIKNNIQNNTSLYLVFQIDENNIGSIASISEIKPKNGELFMQVKTEAQSWWSTGIYTGIGKFFVPEGTGRKIEQIRGDMLVKVKLDTFGTAKIIDLYYLGEKINPKTFTP